MAVAGIAGRDLLTLVFAMAAIGSLVVGGVATYNYYQFYPALKQVQVNIPNLEFYPNSTSLNAFVVFTIENPSSYSGLTLTGFESNYTIETPNGTIRQGFLPFNFPLPLKDSLAQGSVFSYNISFPGDTKGPSTVYQLVQSGIPKSQIIFHFEVDLRVSSFMDAIATLQLVYACSSSIGVGSCSQAGVLLFTGTSKTTPNGGQGGV